jgi:hypothetical protein
LAKEPVERYPTCGELVAAAESELGLRRPARFGGRVAVAVVAIATAIAATLAVAVVVRGRGPAAPPLTRANTLVRIDPRTNNVERVIGVGGEPRAVAAWHRTVWVYSETAGVVSEVDAQTNRILHTTPISGRPVSLATTVGPVLAADRSGAWIVGVDRRGRSLLTLVLPGGGRRPYPLGGRPMAVATGLHAVWVLDHGRQHDRLLRLDPATGRLSLQARLPLWSGVDTLAFGFRNLWLVGSTTAMLYRVDPRSGTVRHTDLGQTAGRPAAMDGAVWVTLSDNGGFTMLVDPRTLREAAHYTGFIGPLGTIGADSAGAFGSVWQYDVGHGDVQKWHPPNLAPHHGNIYVTDPPIYGGNCITSLAAGGGAIWVTLARPRVVYSCDLF